MLKAIAMRISGAPLMWYESGLTDPPATLSPYIGTPPRVPTKPIAAVATQERTVNQTTHGFLRRRASEMAPRIGTLAAMMMEEIDVAQEYTAFDAPRSTINQVARYSDTTFIDQIVFEKSYSAQLQRSSVEARRAGPRSSSPSAEMVIRSGDGT